MRKFTIIIFLFASVIKLNAQEAQNIADLDFLYKSIQELPSFKEQLKGDKSYQQLYENLRKDLKTENELEVYRKMYKLISPIKDNHLGFYKIVDTLLKPRPLKLELDIDSLKRVLEQKPINGIDGIYESNKQQIAIFKNIDHEFYVVHLQTKTVIGFLMETPHQSLDYISLLSGNRGIVLNRNVKQINGNFAALDLFKTEKPIFSYLKIENGNFEFKKINNQIGYLRLSSFYASNTNIAASVKFLGLVKYSINTQNLIVDVRNNSGGGFKTSQQFINFLGKYKGKIFILQNEKTASNAEKFIVRLKRKENVITLGEVTVGTLAYGSNYGKTIVLPNRKFYFYPTDTFDRIDFEYENVGVKPDVSLNAFTEDWVKQTIKYIEAN